MGYRWKVVALKKNPPCLLVHLFETGQYKGRSHRQINRSPVREKKQLNCLPVCAFVHLCKRVRVCVCVWNQVKALSEFRALTWQCNGQSNLKAS